MELTMNIYQIIEVICSCIWWFILGIAIGKRR
jgi:hypothetical protein